MILIFKTQACYERLLILKKWSVLYHVINLKNKASYKRLLIFKNEACYIMLLILKIKRVLNNNKNMQKYRFVKNNHSE